MTGPGPVLRAVVVRAALRRAGLPASPLPEDGTVTVRTSSSGSVVVETPGPLTSGVVARLLADQGWAVAVSPFRPTELTVTSPPERRS